DYRLLQGDAREVGELLAPESVDFCVSSPPYWDILRQRRTADKREERHYGDRAANLGEIREYDAFLAALRAVFEGLWRALRPGGYCCLVVMDLRKGARFYPLHQEVAHLMEKVGFTYDDLIVWDRRAEYNNLRPLGYPCKFRINKVHEFILIFEKIVADGTG
ncbi:MAG TPA: site-specific DNA-methyltransferase, partial [Chromatiales bacterium]|nr:site-specific DNA-methyltransferase [Chromatiales bacterium]